MQHHNYALSDIENLIPWERDIYLDMLITFLKEEKEKRREEQMNTTQFKKVQKFYDTMPRLKHTIKVRNPKTKKMNDITLAGLNDFFA